MDCKKTLLENGYKEVKCTKAIQKEFPCGIEVLNNTNDRYYMFEMNNNKIVYGMFHYFLELGSEYIFVFASQTLYKK